MDFRVSSHKPRGEHLRLTLILPGITEYDLMINLPLLTRSSRRIHFIFGMECSFAPSSQGYAFLSLFLSQHALITA